MAARKKASVRSVDRPRVHPGAILREDILPALRKTKTEVAELLGISRVTLHDLLKEKSGITPNIALRIGKLTGTTPLSWLNMQNAYDLWHAERQVREELKAIPTLTAA